MILADIKVYGKKEGYLSVYYTKIKPKIYKGPFLKEEYNLMYILTERLGRLIERKKADKKLKDYLGQIEKMNDMMVGRELKMIELKKELKKLKEKK